MEKIIHQIWVGPNIIPKREKTNIKKVKELNPHFEHMLWTDKNLPTLPNKIKNAVDFFMAKKDYAFAADVLRCFFVKEYGGLYIDVDFEPLKQFTLFENNKNLMFVVYKENDPTLSNGIFGGVKDSDPVNYVYDTIDIDANQWYGPSWFGATVKKYLNLEYEVSNITTKEKCDQHRICYCPWNTFEEYFRHLDLYSWSPEYKKFIEQNKTNIVKKLLTPYDLGYTKTRIGQKRDGGYILYKEILEKSNTVFSLGVGNRNDKEYCSFSCELELANMNKKILMYDSQDFTYSYLNPNMVFKRGFITSALLNECLEKITDNNLTMLADIEGSEYEIFLNVDEKNLLKFSQISIEVHGLPFAKDLIPLLERFNKHYFLFHIHGNNFSRLIDDLPEVIELSFLRKDLSIKEQIEKCSFPIKDIDYPNDPSTKDYTLDWWID